MSGQWPPEWEDPEEEFPEEADQLERRKPKRGCPRSPRSSRRFPLLSCRTPSRRGSARRSRRRPPRRSRPRRPRGWRTEARARPGPPARAGRHRGGGPGRAAASGCARRRWRPARWSRACSLAGLGFALSRASSSRARRSQAPPPGRRRHRPRRAPPRAARRGRGAAVPRACSTPERGLAFRGYRERHQVPAGDPGRRCDGAVARLDGPRGRRSRATSAASPRAEPGTAGVRAPLHERGGSPARRPGHLPGSACVRHCQFKSRVGGGTRLHGGQPGTHRVGAAGWLTRESSRPSIG